MAGPALAQNVDWGGGTGDWSTPGNWNPATVPGSSNDATIGSGTAEIDGSNEEINGLYLTGGTLNIVNGGDLQVNQSSFLGTGDIQVQGSGSTFATTSDFVLGRQVGATSITVSDGGQVSTHRSFIGEGEGTMNSTSLSATVDGTGSTWNVDDFFAVGGSATVTATLNISDGGKMIAGSTGVIGRGGLGSATVTGSGSELRLNDSNLAIGQFFNTQSGDGTLTIENNGLVTANTVYVGGDEAGSSGTLHLDGAPGSEGVLLVRSLRKDVNGNASVEFDGGILRAREDSTAFISGFDDGELVISGGNLFIDSNGFTVTVSSALTGTGGVYKIGTGTTILTADSSALSGVSQVQNGTLSVNGILGGSMEVRNGRLQGTGQVGDTDNFSDGTIAPGNSIGTLTVAGNYVGHDGTLEIETVLGGDDSETDLLVITGDTSGNTFVKVINLGGSGGPTTEGIKVVDVGGASNGTFSLNGDFAVNGEQAVVGGAYYYMLEQNGIGANSTDGDWYLRSRGLSPAAPVYESYPQVIVPLISLPTLQQRVGERYWEIAQGQTAGMVSGDGSPAGRTGGEQDGIWMRIEGGHGRHTPTESTTNAQYDSDGWKMQFGIDGMMLNTDAGKLIGGITVHYGQVSADITSPQSKGGIDTDSYGAGVTLTWYGAEGFYSDAQAQATWLDSRLYSSTLGRNLSDGNDAFGYATSLEIGQRIANDRHWTLTPQGQLTYSNVNIDAFTDPFGATVSLEDGESLRGRLGLAAENREQWETPDGSVSRLTSYGIANLYQEFMAGSSVNLSGVALSSTGEDVWGGIGVGASYDWNDDQYSIYGEVMTNTGLANFGDSFNVAGTVGLRMLW